MIICITTKQLIEWVKCKNFQIDLSFKRVAGEINEFEINHYNTEHNLSKLNLLLWLFIIIFIKVKILINEFFQFLLLPVFLQIVQQLLHIKEFFELYLILYTN